ncbi:MAG TPA: hypothetical protein VMH81_13305 [Bryobacteraceae bacterium]|nr:hypothetical protein [Bryobacteraceae bacterium]
MQPYRTLLLAASLAGAAFGQAGATSQPDTLQALLVEVRQLHQTLVVIQRLAVQQQHVDALSRQLDQVQQQIAQSAQESNTLTAALAANEARLAKEQQIGAVRHDIEDEIKRVKAVMGENAARDQLQQVRQNQLAGQLQAEEAKLRQLNDRLDELERASSNR